MSDPALPAAEYREVQEDRLTKNRRSYPLSAFFDGPALERYQMLSEYYDPDLHPDLPRTFEQTDLCQRLVKVHAGEAAARAVREGNVSLLSYLTGLTNKEIPLSETRTVVRTLNEMRRPGYMELYVGGTNHGKTNTALWRALLLLLDMPELQLATNVSSLEWDESDLNERTHVVESKTELRSVCEEHQDVIAVLDELSTQANAQTNNYDVNSEFYPLITFKSKLGLRLICIFHREDGYDAAPAFRAHTTYFARQQREEHDLEDDEYSVALYRDMEDGEFRNEVAELPVPPLEPDGWYDPDEQATFEIAE